MAHDDRRRHPVRITPLPQEEWSDQAIDAMSILPAEMQPTPGHRINSLGVLAHHPDLAAAHLAFSLYLRFGSTLNDRMRELLILRTAWIRGAQYELTRHARNARRYGFTDDELRSIPIGSTAPGWDPLEVLLLRAAEELCHDSCVGDATWSGLAEHCTQQQLMDIVFTVGAYDMLAMAFNSMGVQPEPDLPAFPPVSG